MRQQLPGVGGPLRRLTEPLQGGLEERLLAVVLNLAVDRGAQRLLLMMMLDLSARRQAGRLTWPLDR